MIVESYRGIIYFSLFGLVLGFSGSSFQEDFLSSIDNSYLVNEDCKINIGLVSNNISNNFNFFSINKLLSHNIVLSSSFFKTNSSKDEIFIQNSFLMKSSSNTLNLQFINNYFFLGSHIDSWKSIGVNYFFIFKKIIFSIGACFPLFNKSTAMVTNSFSIECKISKNISLNYSFIDSPNFNSNALKLSYDL